MWFLNSVFLSMILTTVIFAIPIRSEENACGFPPDRPKRADITCGGRQISVIGWNHLAPTGPKYNAPIKAISAALVAATAKNCPKAKEILQKVLTDQAKDEGEGLAVKAQLEAINKDHQLNALGEEFTPEQEASQQSEIDFNNTSLTLIGIVCKSDDATRVTVGRFKSIFPGPVYEFSKSTPVEIPIKGLEDKDKRAQAEAVVAKLVADGVKDVEESTLTPQSKRLVCALETKMRTGSIPSDDEINAAVDAQGINSLAKNLKKVLGVTRDLIAANSPRNKAIADSVTKDSGGNYAIVIGLSHFDDLVQQIANKCTEIAPDQAKATVRQVEVPAVEAAR